MPCTASQAYNPKVCAVILMYMSTMGGCVSSNAEQEANADLQRRGAVTGWSDRRGIPENATRVEYTEYQQLKVGRDLDRRDIRFTSACAR